VGKRARIRERREPIGGSALVTRREAAAHSGDVVLEDDLSGEIGVDDDLTDRDEESVEVITAQAIEPDAVTVAAADAATDNG